MYGVINKINMTTFYQNYSLERITKIKPLNDFCSFILRQKGNSIIDLKEALTKLVNSTFVTDLINFELQNLENKTLYVTTPASFNHFTIFDCPLYSLFIISKSSNNLDKITHCSPHASDRFIIPLNENGFIGDLYAQESPYPIDIIEKSKKLTIIKQDYNFKKNELIYLKKDVDILSYSSKNKKNILFLAFYSKDEGQYVWEYNLQTLLPEKIVARNFQSTSRLEQACALLGEVENPKSLPYLFNLLKHLEFNVRWQSAKSIMMIDFEKGLEALEELKNDKHPEIINAINKSLQQLTNLNLI
jgi:hypothetical protein